METPQDIAALIARLRAGINDALVDLLAQRGVKDLAPSHGAVLAALYEQGALSMQQLAAAIERDKSTLTVLVRKLEFLGYVQRRACPQDSRRVLIDLTAKGRRFKPAFGEISQILLARIWGDTPPRQQQALYKGLKKMLARLQDK